MLTLISLAIVMALLYLVTKGTQLSASQKRYKTALAASYGGAEVFTKELIPQIFNNYSTSKLITDYKGIDLALSATGCLQQKLNMNTSDWGSACSAAAKTFDPKTAPDASFKLKGYLTQPGFKVYSKIVDTRQGNSDQSGFELLDSGAGVTGTSAGVGPKHMPALYKIEVQGERETQAQEKANLTVLYAY